MAADLINAVLKAENSARRGEAAARAEAEKITEAAKQKAKGVTDAVLQQAESEALLISSEAELTADGIIKQAERLARLRERKVISETEKRYEECIKLVLDNLV